VSASASASTRVARVEGTVVPQFWNIIVKRGGPVPGKFASAGVRAADASEVNIDNRAATGSASSVLGLAAGKLFHGPVTAVRFAVVKAYAHEGFVDQLGGDDPDSAVAVHGEGAGAIFSARLGLTPESMQGGDLFPETPLSAIFSPRPTKGGRPSVHVSLFVTEAAAGRPASAARPPAAKRARVADDGEDTEPASSADAAKDDVEVVVTAAKTRGRPVGAKPKPKPAPAPMPPPKAKAKAPPPKPAPKPAPKPPVKIAKVPVAVSIRRSTRAATAASK